MNVDEKLGYITQRSKLILCDIFDYRNSLYSWFVPLPSIGVMSLDFECEEELPSREVPQLETRSQRVPDHVHGPQDRKDGQIHG